MVCSRVGVASREEEGDRCWVTDNRHFAVVLRRLRATREDQLRGQLGRPQRGMAEAHLHGERQSHGLPRPARDHAANLRRLPLVASVPAGTPGRRTASPRGEALPAAGQEVFRKPRGSRAHLHVVPGQREIRRALSTAGGCDGHGSAIYQPRAEAALGVHGRARPS